MSIVDSDAVFRARMPDLQNALCDWFLSRGLDPGDAGYLMSNLLGYMACLNKDESNASLQLVQELVATGVADGWEDAERDRARNAKAQN